MRVKRAAAGVSMTKSSSVRFFKIEFLKLSSGFSVAGAAFDAADVGDACDDDDDLTTGFGAGFEVVTAATLAIWLLGPATCQK